MAGGDVMGEGERADVVWPPVKALAPEGGGARSGGDRGGRGMLLDRVMGLESEMAVRFHPDEATAAEDWPSNGELFDAMVDVLKRRWALAPAVPGKWGYFLQTGGAIWCERARQSAKAALVESSTPECRGPRELLLRQRAQEKMLVEAARDVRLLGEMTLCKSDRDAAGEVYGAQENYECDVSGGWGWKCAVVVCMPFVVLSLMMAAVIFLGILVGFAAATVVFVGYFVGAMLRIFPARRGRRVAEFLFGRQLARRGTWNLAQGETFPQWMDPLVHWALVVFCTPAALAITIASNLTAFVPHRRALGPFLASRCVMSGSGYLMPDGKYAIAAKALGMRVVAGMGELYKQRPIFSYGHFFKAATTFSISTTNKHRRLFAERQRLQISLGDSNLCQEAEYLRIATTALVLDVVEAGEMPAVPKIGGVIKAMRTWVKDPTLKARWRGMTAVEVQRWYHRVCKAFVDGRENAGEEARDVVRRWGEVLDLLEGDASSLVGRVDWVTKLYLLQQCGDGASPEARKKIDLRYHELSPGGYHHQLMQTGVEEEIWSEAEIERAMGKAPVGTVAQRRAQELVAHHKDASFKVYWASVSFGVKSTSIDDA